MLGIPVDYSDIEGIEPEYYKSLKQILEYSLEDLGLELTFSAESQTFGKHQVFYFVELYYFYLLMKFGLNKYYRLLI